MNVAEMVEEWLIKVGDARFRSHQLMKRSLSGKQKMVTHLERKGYLLLSHGGHGSL